MLRSIHRLSRPLVSLSQFDHLLSVRLLSTDSKDDKEPTIDFGYKEVPIEAKQKLVGEVFSSVASSYDIMNDLMSGGLHRLWKDRFVDKLAVFQGMQHLDVAGGTGDITFRILDELKRVQRGGGSVEEEESLVTVCDINADMLEEGKKKAIKSGYDMSSIEWIEGNAETLPFPDNTYDSYTIAFGIRNVTNKPAALREALRVLKPGGRFSCLEFSKVVIPGVQQLYDLYSFNVIPEIGRIVAGDRESYAYLVESIRMFPDQERFKEMIVDAGFGSVGYENLTGGIVAIHSGYKPRT